MDFGQFPHLWIPAIAAGVASGVASMLVYSRYSPQQQIKSLMRESDIVRKSLACYDGDFQGAMILVRSSIGISLQRLRCSLVPSLVAGVPVLLGLSLVGGAYLVFFIAVSLAAWLTKWATGIQ